MTIRTARFALTADTFAAERRAALQKYDAVLHDVVRKALSRVGMNRWEEPIVAAALRVFDETAALEQDEETVGFQEMRDEFERELTAALKKTKTGDPDKQALSMSRWLSTYSINAGTEAAVVGDEANVGLEWITMGDADVRESHQEAGGQTVPSGQPFTVAGEELLFPGQPVGDPSVWLNCVLGSTQVGWAGQSVVNATRRAYEGTFVHVRSARGHVLTITPNHPVLTPNGYVAAGCLSVGDYVLASPDPVDPKVNDAPPSIEQVFGALGDAGVEQRVVGSAMDFHGDGTTAEVQIVGADRYLARPVRTEGGNARFVGLTEGHLSLAALSQSTVPASTVSGVARGDAATSDVGGGGVGTALLRREARHADQVGLGAATQGEVEFPERPGYWDAADAEFPSHLQDALALGMTPAQVVSVEVDTGSHDVYNLHTSDNYYSANGIAVHNCRCMARPAVLEDGFKAATVTAAADSGEPGTAPVEEAKNTSSVIVAVPANGDPIYDTSSEDVPHVTLLWLGDAADFDPEPIKAELDAYTTTFPGGPFDESVASSPFTLGAEGAEVVLIDAENLANIRGAILASETVRARHDQVEQFPTWIPHLTLGYPEAPKKGEIEQGAIRFDRIALWHGDEKFVFPLAGNVEVVDAEGAEPVVTDPLVAAAPGVTRVTPDEEKPEGPLPAEPVEDEQEPPELDEAELFMPVPWHGLLAPAGVPSGDARMFALDALTNADLPVALKRQREEAPGHDGSFPVGRIDKVWKDEAGATWGEGVFDYNEDGYESVRLIAEGIQNGLSVDVDSVVGEKGPDGTDVYTEARIRAVTICTIPAFAESKIFLGPALQIEEDEVETEEMPIPNKSAAAIQRLTSNVFDIAPRKTKDGPGWITEPKPTKRITGYWVDGPGAPKIGWGAPGDFNRCRLQLGKYVQNPEWLAGLCANLHFRALGAWPGQASGKAVTMSSLTAAAAVREDVTRVTPVFPSEWFEDPKFTEKVPVIVDGDHVSGYLATWDTCHIGYAEECTAPPESTTGYASFLTGELDTDKGPVRVGQITMGAGHADAKLGIRAAASHYDNTATAIADITVGEDAIGIWFNGALRPDATPKQIHELRASGNLSGDWRGVRMAGKETMEMIAALAVNVGGFPIPRTRYAMSGKRQVSLVAAGMVVRDSDQDAEDDARLDAALTRRERASRARKARDAVKASQVASIRRRVNIEGK